MSRGLAAVSRVTLPSFCLTASGARRCSFFRRPCLSCQTRKGPLHRSTRTGRVSPQRGSPLPTLLWVESPRSTHGGGNGGRGGSQSAVRTHSEMGSGRWSERGPGAYTAASKGARAAVLARWRTCHPCPAAGGASAAPSRTLCDARHGSGGRGVRHTFQPWRAHIARRDPTLIVDSHAVAPPSPGRAA